MGLFSSFGVDSGTRLLLKSLAQKNIIPEEGRVLDAGCGTGVIAVSLKKRFPELDVTAADRDALALNFTAMNAHLNKLPHEGFGTTAGFLPGSLRTPLISGKQQFDLIVSNIPAKAGNPVIKDFLQNCGLHLSEKGKAAVVIVAPLADFAENCLVENGAEITFREADKQYTVFHFIPGRSGEYSSLIDIYRRSEGKTAGFYGLPEFDSVSYSTRNTLETLKNFNCRGETLIWNPGVGHIPCTCNTAEKIILAGSDLLQLKASAYNLASEAEQLHLPGFFALSDYTGFHPDYIIAAPNFISGAEVESEILQTSSGLLQKRGRLLISGKSSDISRVEKYKKGFIIKNSIKFRGFRSLLLEKL